MNSCLIQNQIIQIFSKAQIQNFHSFQACFWMAIHSISNSDFIMRGLYDVQSKLSDFDLGMYGINGQIGGGGSAVFSAVSIKKAIPSKVNYNTFSIISTVHWIPKVRKIDFHAGTCGWSRLFWACSWYVGRCSAGVLGSNWLVQQTLDQQPAGPCFSLVNRPHPTPGSATCCLDTRLFALILVKLDSPPMIPVFGDLLPPPIGEVLFRLTHLIKN